MKQSIKTRILQKKLLEFEIKQSFSKELLKSDKKVLS